MAKSGQGRKPAAKSKEELRRESRQQLEKQKHVRKAILVISLVAVIVLAAVILSLTVFFKITVVEVDASKTQYSADQVRDASGISVGDNLFLMNRENVATRIGEQLPYTGDITVKRSLPSKVRIEVKDSTIRAAVRYNDQFIVLNEQNKVLAKVNSVSALNSLVEKQAEKAKALTGQSPKKEKKTDTTTTTATTTTTTAPSEETVETTTDVRNIAGGEDLSKVEADVVIITGVDVKEAKVGYPLKAKNAEVFETYNRIMEAFSARGLTEMTAADMTKLSDIKLTYQRRITILLGSATALDRKAAMCVKVLEEQDKISTEQKGTIDLSIEGKAYFSEGGATTRTTTTTTTTTTTLPVTDVNTTVSVPDLGTTVAPVDGTTLPAETGTEAATPGATVTATTENDLVNTGG